MKLNALSKVVDSKEIKYFVNENGANIEVVKIETNSFSWYGYCTIDLYVNIYNDDFSKKVSFHIDNFNTGITGESWFEDDEYQNEEKKEELISQISDILTPFFNHKKDIVSKISSIFKNSDGDAIVELIQEWEDFSDTEIDNIVDDFETTLLGKEGDNRLSTESRFLLSSCIAELFNNRETTILNICSLIEGTNKEAVTETFECYEGDGDKGEDVDVDEIADMIADEMPYEVPEPTEEDSWQQTLDYFGYDDYYDTWEGYKDFWNSFKKYCEDYDDDDDIMYGMMIDDENVEEYCVCGYSGDEGGVFDFEVIKPDDDGDYAWEGEYKDERGRFVEMPVNIGLNKSGSERQVVRNLFIDTMFIDQYLNLEGIKHYIYSKEKVDFDKLNIYVGEWLVDLWGCARKGRLIGDYCLGGYAETEWEGESTFDLLRFWKLTDVQEIEIAEEKYIVFYSGARSWRINYEQYNREKDFFPIGFTYVPDLPNEEMEIEGKVIIQGKNDAEEIYFTIELTSVEANIYNHYCEYCRDMDYFPKELYTKLVSHLQQAYLEETKDDPDAIKSIEELNSLGCKYSFPDIEN